MVSSLTDLSFQVFCESLEDARMIEYSNLPRVLKRKMRQEVKKLWGAQKALTNVDEFNYSSIDLWDMNRLEFNMVMNHPFEVPEFVFENNHVVWDYYLWESDEFTFNTCVICARKLFQFNDEQAEYYWGMKKTGWKFFHNKNHKQIDGAEMLNEVIWDLDNYCDICVIQSLYRIYSEERCREELTIHYSNVHDSDSSTDDYDLSSQLPIHHTPQLPTV